MIKRRLSLRIFIPKVWWLLLSRLIKTWWRMSVSNWPPTACKAVALPDELIPQKIFGAPCLIRTDDLSLTRRLLWPTELRGHLYHNKIYWFQSILLWLRRVGSNHRPIDYRFVYLSILSGLYHNHSISTLGSRRLVSTHFLTLLGLARGCHSKCLRFLRIWRVFDRPFGRKLPFDSQLLYRWATPEHKWNYINCYKELFYYRFIYASIT